MSIVNIFIIKYACYLNLKLVLLNMKLKSTEEIMFTQQTLRAFGSFSILIRTYSDETPNLIHSKYSSQCILLPPMKSIPSLKRYVEWF